MKLQKRGDEEMPGEQQQKDQPAPKKKTQESVLIYMALLFTVAFLLILLSYFIQERRNNDTISSLTEQHGEFTMQAMENIEALQNKNLELQQENDALNEKIDALTEENDALGEKVGELESKIDRLKEDWNAAIESVETSEKEKVEDAVTKRQAAEYLLDLYMAQQNGGDVTEAAAAAAPYAEHLDGAYSELYESIINQIDPEG